MEIRAEFLKIMLLYFLMALKLFLIQIVMVTSFDSRLFAIKSSGSQQKKLKLITVEDIHSDGYKLEQVVKMLQDGCCGVIPTDTCYSFVASAGSRTAVDTLLKCKNSGKKPLSFLCKDISMVSEYTDQGIVREKWVFKMLKSLLPGPFTFILPTSEIVPKFVLAKRRNHKLRKWKRKEIGIRIPNDDISRYIMQRMDMPLLTGSIPEAGEDYVDVNESLQSLSTHDDDDSDFLTTEGGNESDMYDTEHSDDDNEYDYSDTGYHEMLHDFPWAKNLDFIVVAGSRGGGTAQDLSTIVDLTSGEPVLVRQGMGNLGEFAKAVSK